MKVYNINKGRNADMAVKSPVLSGYEEFIAEIKGNLKSMGLGEAVKLAVKACISKNILLSFLERNGSEVEKMLWKEWNMDDALAVAKEEGKEEALEEAFSLLRQGYSIDEAEKLLAKRET